MSMKTKQICDLLGISGTTLRYYEEQGIIHPKRNHSNHRQYEVVDLMKLMLLQEIRRKNVSLTDVSRFMMEETDDALKEMMIAQWKELIWKKEIYDILIKNTSRSIEEFQNYQSSLDQMHVEKIPSICLIPAFEVQGEDLIQKMDDKMVKAVYDCEIAKEYIFSVSYDEAIDPRNVHGLWNYGIWSELLPYYPALDSKANVVIPEIDVCAAYLKFDLVGHDLKQSVFRIIQSVLGNHMIIDERYPIMLEWCSFSAKNLFYKVMIPIRN